VVAYAVWWVVDDLVGRSLLAQIASVGAATLAGTAVYGAAVWALGVPEAKQIAELFGSRLRGRRGGSG
jgi:hypothetical protein